MKIGYVRVDRTGPSPLEQQKALKEDGFDNFGDDGPIYVDGLRTKKVKAGEDALPQRTEALRALRPGDVLVVANAGRLGASREDILRVLGLIGQAGAGVLSIAERSHFEPVPQVHDAAVFADTAHQTQMAERAAKARRGAKAFGSKRGPPIKLKRARLDDLRPMWGDPDVRIELVEAEAGVKRRTLYRLLGPRGTPFFGRPGAQPKGKKRK
jgi:DNA invertase Pin-like site-specific DNA recombinase